jgi:CBS domain-containing protein
MTTVRDVLSRKGSDVFTIELDASVFDALKRMAQEDVGALVVVERNAVIGVISERDYARKVILRGESSKDIPVARIMTRRVVTVTPDASIDECMGLMTDKRIRHLPVVEDGSLCGVVSIGDVVKALLAEKDFVIERLEEYIRYAH